MKLLLLALLSTLALPVGAMGPQKSHNSGITGKNICLATAAVATAAATGYYAFRTVSNWRQQKRDDRLLLAVKTGTLEEIEALLKDGANPNIKVTKHQHRLTPGDTPLILATQANNLPIITLLITYKANVDAQDKRGLTALMHAALNDNPDSLQMLLTAGANVAINCDYTKRRLPIITDEKIFSHYAFLNIEPLGITPEAFTARHREIQNSLTSGPFYTSLEEPQPVSKNASELTQSEQASRAIQAHCNKLKAVVAKKIDNAIPTMPKVLSALIVEYIPIQDIAAVVKLSDIAPKAIAACRGNHGGAECDGTCLINSPEEESKEIENKPAGPEKGAAAQ